MTDIKDRVDGVVIGIFLGFGQTAPLVVFPGNPDETALPARSLAELSSEMIGSEVALLFENGDSRKPLIVGRIVDPAGRKLDPDALRDGETVNITASERLELRCGKSVIILEKDGHVTVRGTYVVSHASAANRIRGGSVNLN
jgi:hypothetical protein